MLDLDPTEIWSAMNDGEGCVMEVRAPITCSLLLQVEFASGGGFYCPDTLVQVYDGIGTRLGWNEWPCAKENVSAIIDFITSYQEES